jgi:predicted transcriptional regulator
MNSNNSHLLISLEERHARNIFAGTKRVELRRREMQVDPGDIVWIYVKLPVGRLAGHATVETTHTMSPSQLWRRFGSRSCLEKAEFFDYFAGVEKAFALCLTDAQALPNPLSLADLREASTGFQPPQFFSRIKVGGPLFSVMTAGHWPCSSETKWPKRSPSTQPMAYA